MKFYGKTLMFRSGVMLQCNIIYACPFACSYCALDQPTGKRPKAKQMGIEQWKKMVKHFPTKIREVFVTGGEPTLVKWMPEFVNWLLDEGYHVILFSMLHDVEAIKKIKPSYRFQVRSTFHKIPEETVLRYTKQYDQIKDIYNVCVDEIGDDKVLPFSVLKPFVSDETMQDDYGFRISPDGDFFINCYEHFFDKSGGKNEH